MYDYEEVCPVSRAASILCERWTLQIVREMLFGASRFSDLQKYLPKLSPTLLNTRLKTLEQQGIVIRTRIAEKRGYEYRLTPCGLALRPVVEAMGKWGMQWAFDDMDAEQLNVSVIVRDFAVALNLDQLPSGDTTLQFNVATSGEKIRKFILVRDRAPQVCDENIGHEVDVYLSADLETLAKIWYGKLALRTALESGRLSAVGSAPYVQRIHHWLGRSQFADVQPQSGAALQAE
ncbi:MAG: winged helix-turn-helix transcriptional regulator [Ketobacter sp.]